MKRRKKILIAILTITGILFSFSAYGESNEDTEKLIRAANQGYSSNASNGSFQKLLYPVAEKNNTSSSNSSPVIYVSDDDIAVVDALAETEEDERGSFRRLYDWAKREAKETYDYIMGGLGEIKDIAIGKGEKGEGIVGKRGENITIAIIDPERINPTYRLKTGEYLGEKLWIDADGDHGWNFIWNNNSIFNNSALTHSTKCANCALEFAPESKIMHLTIGDIPEAIRYAVDNDAKVISMSFGVQTTIYYRSPPDKFLGRPARSCIKDEPEIQRAINYAHSKDVVIVSSVGNDNSNVLSYPAACDNVIGVAGTRNGKRWVNSNYGNFVDIAASAVVNTTYYYNDTCKVHVEGEGTSFSAPRVAGVVATLQQENPALRAIEITNILYNTADDKGPTGWDPYTGYGEVNLTAALQAVRSLPNLNSSERDVLLNQPVKSEKKISIKKYIQNGLSKIHTGLKHLVQKLTS